MFAAIHHPYLSSVGLHGWDLRGGVRNRSSFMRRQKKTPPKAGFFGFSLGVFPSFHSVKKPSSQMNIASEIRLSKSS